MLLTLDLRIVEGRKCLKNNIILKIIGDITTKKQTKRFVQIFFSFDRLHTNSHNFFRCKICTYVNNFFNATSIKVETVNKLEHDPATPIDQLRIHIARFRQIETNKSTPWSYCFGGGSGSGSILLIVKCCLVCWRCKYHQSKKPDQLLIAYTVPENPNMMDAKEGAIRTGQSSDLGQETVGIQDSVCDKRMVLNYDMQNNTFASAFLDQLEDLNTNVKEHHRRLRPRQYSAISQIEN